MITQQNLEQFIEMRKNIQSFKNFLGDAYDENVIEIAHHIMFEKNKQAIVMIKNKFDRLTFNEKLSDLISSFDESIFGIKKRSSGRIIMENGSVVLFCNERDIHLRGRAFTLIHCLNESTLVGHPYRKTKTGFFEYVLK